MGLEVERKGLGLALPPGPSFLLCQCGYPLSTTFNAVYIFPTVTVFLKNLAPCRLRRPHRS